MADTPKKPTSTGKGTYKFRGVPKTFESKQKALDFLNSSPGYVSRQGEYLSKFWPGLMDEVKPKADKKGGFLGGLARGLEHDLDFLKAVDEAQSKVTGIHAKTVAKTYIDPLRKDFWPQLGGSGKSILSPQQKAEQQSFADSVMMFHGIGGAPAGLARPAGVRSPGAVALGHSAAKAQPVAARLATEETGMLGLRRKAASEATPIGPKTLDESIQEGLKGARATRKAQEAGYSVERAKRFKEFEAAVKANPTIEGFNAAKTHLAGELPKLEFEGFSELNQDALNAMVKRVAEHPDLLTGQKLSIVHGLEKASQGITPTNSELDKIEMVFGQQVAQAVADPVQLSALQHAKQIGVEVLNIPRSLMASFDLSAPFRQGLVAGARHPVMFGRNFRPMVKAWKSQKFYDQVLEDIHVRPSFPRMKEAKLAIQEAGSKDLMKREEQFYSNIAEKLPPVRASSRAYTLFLTKMRADMFDHLLPRLEAEGHDINDPAFLQGLGRYINAATGRGSLGNFESAGHLLNTMFFSPRLMMSRLNLLYPGYYAKLPAGVRKEALRAAFQTVGTLSTMLTLAAYGGAKVVLDPRNADFGKIRIGNTRVDVAAGFQQPIKTLAQLITGTRISSQTGNRTKLGPGFGNASRFDVALQFFTNKASPLAGIVIDKLKGENFAGETFSWKTEAATHLTPLLAQDALDIYNDKQGGVDGITAAMLGYGVGAFGLGVQTYGEPSKSSAPEQDPYSAPADTASDPYFTGTSSSGSDPYMP